MSISVRFVERQLGRTEASIMSDARQPSDVRIPVLPKSCDIGGVRVPRTIGHVGMSAADLPIFLELKKIFPILSGWVVTSAGDQNIEQPELRSYSPESPEEIRFDLAQSVLLLNVSGALPASLLVDAACYGVPCVGPAKSAEQLKLWPELTAANNADAVSIARDLLTNAAWMQRESDQARNRCLRLYAPNEDDSAFWLRQLHARQLTAAAIGMAV
jgi:hypothetical protein